MSRIYALESKLLSSGVGGSTSVSDDKLKSLVSENEELKQKVNTLESMIKDVSKKADDFSKITNENTKNIANNLKTLQDGLTKVEIASKVDGTAETPNPKKVKN
tara:strand:- start:5979 stop:6290 length:312 start_codon:yes stop_codon:yes gene_type:complete